PWRIRSLKKSKPTRVISTSSLHHVVDPFLNSPAAPFTCIKIGSSEADFVAFNSNLLAVNACAIVNCGQGTCRETGGILISFECDCYPGWTKFSLFPLCIIPNSCTFTWCGDGSCKANGTGYECDCNEGYANLLANPTLPCFKECNFFTKQSY
ncbi:hypothetical protein E1A91_A08G267800v1, partial [Gossypium mustelinum]